MENSKVYIFQLPTSRFVKGYGRSMYEAREKAWIKHQNLESNRNNYILVSK